MAAQFYDWTKDTAERCARGAAVVMLVRIVALTGADLNNGGGFDALALGKDWISVLSYGLGSVIGVFLLCVVARRTSGTPGTASFVREATAPPVVAEQPDNVRAKLGDAVGDNDPRFAGREIHRPDDLI